MKIPLSRTSARLIHSLKGFVFDKANFQKMVDLRQKHELEDSMGFRGQWDSHRKFQIDFLRNNGLTPSSTFLELGCGPLTAGIPVMDYLEPNKYVGVDIRASVLNLAWREVGKAGLSSKNPRLICSSSFGSDILSRDHTFDIIYSFSVLYHLNDEVLDDFFSEVSRRLAAGGKCFANVNDHLESDKWLEFPFVKRGIETYRAAAAKHGLNTTKLGTIHSLGFGGPGTEKLNPLLIFSRRT
ncbi:class I SAM-dependent methyltransferase [Nitrobacter sp. Nb-311A]|uniref:class I SAM-dependent methyltransferase n=1 Tax=Nitrobacter sp. Nb-311A TaxID=314253 RepID=UPI00103C30DC|nr:class I SAM-dependent methyltransferase [Nitrobacter sp. Nb-311A]